MNKSATSPPATNTNPKVICEMKQLGGFFNPVASAYTAPTTIQPSTDDPTTATANTQVSNITQETLNLLIDRRLFLPDIALTGMDYDTMPVSQYKDAFVPLNMFNEAWNHSCPSMPIMNWAKWKV